MFDFKLDEFTGLPLCDLPNELIMQAHRNDLRPTIKTVLVSDRPVNGQYNRPRYQMASYEVGQPRDPHAQLFNLPGGGLDAGEAWIGGLRRELQEELGNLLVADNQLADATVLVADDVATSRPGHNGKLLVIVALHLPPEQYNEMLLTPTNHELRALQLATICDTAVRLNRLADTNPDSKVVFWRALTELHKLLNLQT